MNSIHHKKIVIDYYVWEPWEKDIRSEEDNLLCLVKEGKLLPHAGYAKTTFHELAVLKTEETTNG